MIIKVSALKGPVSMAAWGNRATTGKRNSALIFIQRDMQDLVNVKLARVLRRAWQEMFTSICFRREFLYHMAILCSYEISLSSLQRLYTCQTGNERLLCFTWSSCLVSLYYVVDNAWIVQTCIEDYDFDVFFMRSISLSRNPICQQCFLGRCWAVTSTGDHCLSFLFLFQLYCKLQCLKSQSSCCILSGSGCLICLMAKKKFSLTDVIFHHVVLTAFASALVFCDWRYQIGG